MKMSKYKPVRDSRFEYVWEAMNYIEEEQCRNCAHSKLQEHDTDRSHAQEYPMCWQVESEFIEANAKHIALENIIDTGDGIVCTKYTALK